MPSISFSTCIDPQQRLENGGERKLYRHEIVHQAATPDHLPGSLLDPGRFFFGSVRITE
ncbi:MAG TPA: hypothetical protein VKM55_04240 [Candidatus Lokiarchaeia archaeon]|nr:hypothetical protein [Candidatus Lokiarchaeia archaeon]